MINALEKVVYPNGKTQSLAEIGGAVEGLSALIDEVDRNTSAISSITSQLSALVSDVNTNTSAIASINQQLGQLVGDWTLLASDSVYDTGSGAFSKNIAINDITALQGKDILLDVFIQLEEIEGYPSNIVGSYQLRVDGDILVNDWNKTFATTQGKPIGGYISDFVHVSNGSNQAVIFSYYQKNGLNGFSAESLKDSVGQRLIFSIYTKTKPTPTTRTAKKKAVVKKKGETK